MTDNELLKNRKALTGHTLVVSMCALSADWSLYHTFRKFEDANKYKMFKLILQNSPDSVNDTHTEEIRTTIEFGGAVSSDFRTMTFGPAVETWGSKLKEIGLNVNVNVTTGVTNTAIDIVFPDWEAVFKIFGSPELHIKKYVRSGATTDHEKVLPTWARGIVLAYAGVFFNETDRANGYTAFTHIEDMSAAEINTHFNRYIDSIADDESEDGHFDVFDYLQWWVEENCTQAHTFDVTLLATDVNTVFQQLNKHCESGPVPVSIFTSNYLDTDWAVGYMLDHFADETQGVIWEEPEVVEGEEDDDEEQDLGQVAEVDESDADQKDLDTQDSTVGESRTERSSGETSGPDMAHIRVTLVTQMGIDVAGLGLLTDAQVLDVWNAAMDSDDNWSADD
jgi:hypothetical protein